jgi:hypothetical protein
MSEISETFEAVVQRIATVTDTQFGDPSLSPSDVWLEAYTRSLLEELYPLDPVCWVLTDDIEYDGTTHGLTTINVCPANVENWTALFVIPQLIKELR